MIYGYARCSLAAEGKQNIDRQVRELKAAGAEVVFQEVEHGDTDNKEQLTLLLNTVKEGDIILTLEVSRLSRSTIGLCKLIEQVKEKKICLNILNSIKVDCRSGSIDPFTQAFLQISSVFAELELNIIRDRVKSGMQAARERGSRIGRPPLTIGDIPQIFYRHYPSYINRTMNISELARVCNLSRNTVYKYIELVSKKEKNGRT